MFPLSQLTPEPQAPIDMVSTSLSSQRLIGGGLGDFSSITMGFSACTNEMPIRIFTSGVLPTFPEVGQRVCSLLSSPSDSLEPHGL